MYWLSFLAIAVFLYLPPLYLAQHFWGWAGQYSWYMLLSGRPLPASLACTWWLFAGYLALGTALHLAHRRLPQEHGLAQVARRLSQFGLGDWEVALVAAAATVLALAWPILPMARALYGGHLSISSPVAALAGLCLLAEGMRLAEAGYWADRAFEAGRVPWLIEQGHYR